MGAEINVLGCCSSQGRRPNVTNMEAMRMQQLPQITEIEQMTESLSECLIVT